MCSKPHLFSLWMIVETLNMTRGAADRWLAVCREQDAAVLLTVAKLP